MQENDYKVSTAKSLLNRVFSGSVKNLVAALYDNKEMRKKYWNRRNKELFLQGQRLLSLLHAIVQRIFMCFGVLYLLL
ncbi:MAG: BlaI/MecI/CopY family transcriptional regulator [Clostridia bacterium]|nr:BlaI/MecI/CopY family transcriptional regulator [Clostridia bacterium]